MFVNAVLFYTLINDALLDILPESVDLFILGFGLIILTIGLRWLMEKTDRDAKKIDEDSIHISV